ncbi:secreted protein [Melampsora americana]|nr:secreted protein [Melampsora americana]
MMRKSSNSKLKEIFLFSIFIYVNFCVKGRPSFFGHITEYAKGLSATVQGKGVAATAQGDVVNNGVRVANQVSENLPDVGTSQALRNPGSGDEKLLETKKLQASGQTLDPNIVSTETNSPSNLNQFSSISATENVENVKGLKNKAIEENSVKSTTKSEETKVLESTEFSKLKPVFEREHIKPYGEKMEFFNSDQVAKLSDNNLIRYMAEKDTEVKNLAMNFQKAAQKHQEAEGLAFTMASHLYKERVTDGIDVSKLIETRFLERQAKKEGFPDQRLLVLIRRTFIEEEARLLNTAEPTFQNFQITKRAYNRAYLDTLQAARNLVSKDSLTTEALSKLSKEEYVKKASYFDQNVYQDYVKWKTEERLMDLSTSKGQEVFEEEWENTMKGLKSDAKVKEETFDELILNQVAKRQFIKKQADYNPNDFQLKQAEKRIYSFEKNIENAKRNALRGAHHLFQGNLLKSAASKLKQTGWKFINFIKRMFAWVSRLGRKPTKTSEVGL